MSYSNVGDPLQKGHTPLFTLSVLLFDHWMSIVLWIGEQRTTNKVTQGHRRTAALFRDWALLSPIIVYERSQQPRAYMLLADFCLTGMQMISVQKKT